MERRTALTTLGFLSLSALVLPMEMTAQNDDHMNSYIESLRADLRADKVAIITEGMQFSNAESDAFWPVYRNYDRELVALNDDLVTLVKTYADKFGSATNTDAAAMTQKSFDIQGRRTDLKKKYYPLFAKATSPLTAAKFFQLEYRLELLFNLKLASELPALLMQSKPAQK